MASLSHLCTSNSLNALPTFHKQISSLMVKAKSNSIVTGKNKNNSNNW